jgi:outer membrane protein TolC
LEPSKSSEKSENRVRVEFLFSFIDFGLAYFNAVQARDRSLITNEEKRRAAQNLILDVSRAYFKVAAAQYAMENTEKMLQLSDETEKLLEQMAKKKKVPLEKVIIEKKTFLLLKKSLMEYKRSYENSCIELHALMGFYHDHDLVVDTSGMKRLANLKVPEIELMEEIALIERPELYQLDIENHITAISARKKIIEMFPNVGIFTDFTNSTNKYLYNQSWWELGVRAAYRLLRVPQQIGEFSALQSEMEQIDAQITALSVGILSQVRIAHANLAEVKQRYILAEELYETYKKHEQIKTARANASGAAISKIELNRIKMETAQKDIERTQALGNYYLAYFRLLNSMGLESLDSQTLGKIKTRINENFKMTREEELEKIAGYKEIAAKYQRRIDEANKKLAKFQADSKAYKDKISSADSDAEKVKNQISSKEKELHRQSASMIAAWKKEISQQGYQLKKERDAVAQAKNIRDKSISGIKAELEEKLKSEKDEEAIGKIKEDYDNKIEKAKEEYEKLAESINSRIESTKERIEALEEKILSENDVLAEKIIDMKEESAEKISELAELKENGSGELDGMDSEIKSLQEELKLLQEKKKDVEIQLETSRSMVEDHTGKLARYVAAINLLDSSNNSSSSSLDAGPSAPDSVDNLTIETQSQGGKKGSLPFTEFSPEATKNIDAQTQQNAGNNKINQLELKPETQKNIDMQTQNDAGNNSIGFQEFGSKYNAKGDKIGNDKLNKKINKQLEQGK